MNGSRRGWRCADELKLASYVDGTLDVKGRQLLEAHLADCKSCLEQVSFLVGSSESPDSDVPASLIARAKNLVREKRRAPIAFGWGWATATLAACLLLTFLVVIAIRLRISESPQSDQGPSIAQQPEPNPGAVSLPSMSPRNPDVIASSSRAANRQPASRSERSVPVIRNAAAENRLPTLLSPRDGAVIKRGDLQLRWQAVSDTVFYEVSIMTASGDTVVSQQTEGTSLKLSEVQLISDTKYFISVRAHLRDGKTARSSIVSFRVSD